MMVISTTKTGNTIILERKTGKPIFNIDYKKAPSSNLIGDFAWPFQIFLKNLKDFLKLNMEKKILINCLNLKLMKFHKNF